MAPTRSSRQSGADTDTSMADVSEIRQLPVDPMVRFLSSFKAGSVFMFALRLSYTYKEKHIINSYSLSIGCR